MNKQLLNRRDFNGLCVALGSSLALVGPAGVALSSAPARAATHTVKLHDGTIVPALGQGSARLGQGKHPEPAEEEALRTGLSLGMTLIDTAEMYGDGRSERLIGRVIAGQRDRVMEADSVDNMRKKFSHGPRPFGGAEAVAFFRNLLGDLDCITADLAERGCQLCAGACGTAVLGLSLESNSGLCQ